MLQNFSAKLFCIFIILHIGTIQVHSETWDTTSQNSQDLRYLNLNITWYYTPLPDQKEYITWSYKNEISLNWDWLHMASWKKVFSWAIAAPSSFPFWSKIYIEWFWVWVVEDRWWSVVNGETTIIDIRMWEWDDWLERTRNWWRRYFKWYQVSDDTKISLEFKSMLEDSYKSLSMNPDSNPEDIKKVQKHFKEILYYNWEIDWKYESIKDTLIKYQIQNWVISWENDEQAWYFWPKTIKSLESDFWLILKKENSLSKKEKEIILNKVLFIKQKLWDDYNKRVKNTIIKIQDLKNKNWILEKTKNALKYLEIIL